MRFMKIMTMVALVGCLDKPESTETDDDNQEEDTSVNEDTDSEPASEASSEPASEPATEPASEPATEPASEPASAPASEPASEPSDEPTSDGVCNSQPTSCDDIGSTVEEQFYGCCFNNSVYWCESSQLGSEDCSLYELTCSEGQVTEDGQVGMFCF